MKILDQSRAPLFEAMKEYHKKNVIPFDVPGHKHGIGIKEMADYFGRAVLELDVNAMKCLDNICNPIGVIKEAQELAARAYGAKHGFFLVNGTTSGVQAMIMSACSPSDKVILPRNAHKSATTALILSGAVPVYIQPEINEELGIAMGVCLNEVETAIEEHPDAKAIFLINPTYYGATSDLKSIVDMAHKRAIAVLVDEAHGAHMRFNKDLPTGAIDVGADMCAVSTHKTGGSLTQSSLLLLNEGIIDEKIVKTTLNLTQTTSASYLLMGSIDLARKQLALHGEEMLDKVLKLSRWGRDEINKIPGLYAFGRELIGAPGVFDFDETKLGVNVRKIGLTGFEVYDILRDEYNIQTEFGDMYNVLGIMSLGDTEEAVEALIRALRDIAKKYRTNREIKGKREILINPEVIVSPRGAYYSRKKIMRFEESEGEISGESIMTYPPGIPVVTPGERITREMIEYVKKLKEEDSLLQGTQDPYVEYIKVLGV